MIVVKFFTLEPCNRCVGVEMKFFFGPQRGVIFYRVVGW